MAKCYQTCFETAKQFAKEGEIPSLVAGANIAGFLKGESHSVAGGSSSTDSYVCHFFAVAQAGKAMGDWW